MKQISRHDFLKISTNSLLAISGLLGLGGLLRYLSYQFDPAPQSEFDIGLESKYPLHSRTVLAHIPAIIVHDKDGLRAISLTCSHLGCTVEERYFGFECPCHNSRYDQDGKVSKGPSTADLRKLHMTKTEDGNLHVFTA